MNRPMNTTDDIVVTPAPGPGSDRTGSSVVDRMRERLRTARPDSHAAALQLLRTEFPESTLSERVCALSTFRAGG